MNFLLVILAIAVAAAVVLLMVFVLSKPRQEPAPGEERSLAQTMRDEALVPAVPNLPPVLLPDSPTAQDVAAVRFSLGLRGYRMDQVDQTLDALAAQLESQHSRISELEAELSQLRQAKMGTAEMGTAESEAEPQDQVESEGHA